MNLRGPDSDSSSQGVLDSVNSPVSVTRTFKVCSYLDGLLCQLSIDVFHQNLLGLLIQTEVLKHLGISNGLLEVVIGHRPFPESRIMPPMLLYSSKWT